MFEKINFLQVIGAKNSGKTMFIEWLIKTLTNKGIKVGALKHSQHTHPIDRPGSDSFRMQRAGAIPTVFWSAEGVAVFYSNSDEENVDLILNKVFKDVDLLVVESLKHVSGPKLMIDPEDQQWNQFDHVIAIISEKEVHTELPVFKRYDLAIIPFLLDYFKITPQI